MTLEEVFIVVVAAKSTKPDLLRNRVELDLDFVLGEARIVQELHEADNFGLLLAEGG